MYNDTWNETYFKSWISSGICSVKALVFISETSMLVVGKKLAHKVSYCVTFSRDTQRIITFFIDLKIICNFKFMCVLENW